MGFRYNAYLAVASCRREAFFRAHFNLAEEGASVRRQLAQIVRLRPIHERGWQDGIVPVENDNGAFVRRWWWEHHHCLICRRCDGFGIYVYEHHGETCCMR